MRIHLPLYPHHFAPPPTSGPSAPSGPLLQLGGDLVLVELQGQLSWEGDKDDSVIGVVGLDRPDKPTLHLGQHHLLHGKFTNLQKPYAVIRRVVGDASSSAPQAGVGGKGVAVQGDLSEEESSDEEEEELFPRREGVLGDGEEEGEEEGGVRSSSPFSYAPSTPKDYSSDIASSPPPFFGVSGGGNGVRDVDADDAGEDAGAGVVEERRKRKRAEEEEKRRKKEKREKWRRRQGEEGREKERTRHYAVVGVVRRKVVFALRPEPLVAPTILPE